MSYVYVAILGSRKYARYDVMWKVIDKLDRSVIVVSGGASGVDTEAVQYAKHYRHLWTMELPANWDDHGKGAGFLRTQRLLLFIKDHGGQVIVFWDGKSKGTKYTIAECNRMGIPISVYGSKGKLIE